MLGKLLKYEIPAMGRKLLPLYAAWAVTAFLLGLSAQSAGSKTEFMLALSLILYIAIATTIFVMTIILIVQRFKNSLLGDEAYFNHVLPVSVSAHIGNKVISATLWICVTILVAILTAILIGIGGMIVYGFGSFSFKEFIHGLMQFNWPKDLGLYMTEGLILAVAAIVKTIMQIYAAITIGHQAPNRTTLASIGAYIAITTFESIIGNMLFGHRFMEYGLYGTDGAMKVFVPTVLMAVCFSAIYFLVCRYLMEKRLNLA